MNAKQLIESIYTDNEFVRSTIGAGYRNDRKAFKADTQSVNDVKQRMRLLREDKAEDALDAFEEEVNTWINDEFATQYDSAVYVWGSPEDKDKLYRLHQQGAEFCSYSWDGRMECSLKLKMGECKKLLANGWRPVCDEDNGDVHEIVFTRPTRNVQQEDQAEDALRALDSTQHFDVGDRVTILGGVFNSGAAGVVDEIEDDSVLVIYDYPIEVIEDRTRTCYLCNWYYNHQLMAAAPRTRRKKLKEDMAEDALDTLDNDRLKVVGDDAARHTG